MTPGDESLVKQTMTPPILCIPHPRPVRGSVRRLMSVLRWKRKVTHTWLKCSSPSNVAGDTAAEKRQQARALRCCRSIPAAVGLRNGAKRHQQTPVT